MPDRVLVARSQLDFVQDLVARLEQRTTAARDVALYQAEYIAIIAMLRSVGHVFEKIDCTTPA